MVVVVFCGHWGAFALVMDFKGVMLTCIGPLCPPPWGLTAVKDSMVFFEGFPKEIRDFGIQE